MANLQLVHEEKSVEVKTLATSAVLIDMSISLWTGRKRDKKSTQEVLNSNHATSQKAASVIKNLMSDDDDLDNIRAYAQDTRLYLMKYTLAWNDAGTRLLPAKLVVEVTSELEARAQEFNVRVQKFLNAFNVKVSAAAFKLGSLFNRAEYPTAGEIERKFGMRYTLSPVPTSGDFRVDVQKDVGQFLKDHYEKAANDRMADMMREPWERLYNTLAHAKQRMETMLAYSPAEGESSRSAPKLFQSMIDNALEQAQLMDKLNVTNDPQLSDCAARIRRLFSNTDIKSLRESKEQQASVKKQVEDILGNFDFSGFTLDE
jgi:hypothetical protein